MLDSVSLRFSNTNVYAGFAAAGGVVRTSPAGLVLEYQVKENLSGSGLLKSGVKAVTIPYAEIQSVSVKKTLVSTKLVVRTKTLSALEEVPFAQPGELELGIARKDRAEAERLVTAVQLQVTTHQLREL